MHILLARLAAVSTGLIIVLLAVAFALAQNTPTTAQTATPHVPDDSGVAEQKPISQPGLSPTDSGERDLGVETGRKLYKEQRCAACHGIVGEGKPRYPLDGVGDKLTDPEIRKWLVSPQEMNPDVRKSSYDHLSRSEIDGLVAYMMSLKQR